MDICYVSVNVEDINMENAVISLIVVQLTTKKKKKERKIDIHIGPTLYITLNNMSMNKQLK